MHGTMPATSQLEWLSSTTAMIVLFWSRATRDLLRSFGWGIAALHRENCSDEVAIPRRPPHSVSRSPAGRRTYDTRSDPSSERQVIERGGGAADREITLLTGDYGISRVPSSDIMLRQEPIQ